MRSILVILMVPALAIAEPCNRTAFVQAGDLAPCTGQLMPEAWAAQGTACIRNQPEVQKQIELIRREGRSDLNLCQQERDAARAALVDVEQVVVPPAPEPPRFYERPAVIWPAAIILGAALGGGIVWQVTR